MDLTKIPFPVNRIVKSARKTMALQINRKGEVIIRVPRFATDKEIYRFVFKHEDWVRMKLTEYTCRASAIVPHTFTEEDRFYFLGIKYSLYFTRVLSGPIIFNEGFFIDLSGKNRAKDLLIQWYRKEARKIISQRVQHFSNLYNFTYNKIRINQAETRWGSCSGKRNLNFTWKLVQCPLSVIDYVVVHELVHLLEPNHSKNFWMKVGYIFPDYKKQKQWLRENQNLIHFE